MEKRTFMTYVNDSQEFDRSYIRGRISGIGFIISGRHRRNGAAVAWQRNLPDGWVYIMECTLEQYLDFCDVIEGFYPGLCRFDTSAMAKSAKDEGLI